MEIPAIVTRAGRTHSLRFSFLQLGALREGSGNGGLTPTTLEDDVVVDYSTSHSGNIYRLVFLVP